MNNITFATIDAECSPVDWPHNHEPMISVAAVVATRSRKKTYGYTNKEVQLCESPTEAVAQAEGMKYQHPAFIERFRDGYRVLCWLDRDGNRWGKLGVTDQRIERATAQKRLIYIIRNHDKLDNTVYVGQTRNLQKRVTGHVSTARRSRHKSEWHDWMAGILFDAGGSLRIDVVDAMNGTFYAAQQLEEIWRKIMIMKGYKPYQWDEKLFIQTKSLLEDVPYYIAHRYQSCRPELHLATGRQDDARAAGRGTPARCRAGRRRVDRCAASHAPL